jgi:FtsH-binding integral membrane protein
MAELRNYQSQAGTGTRADAAIDEGLRAYMLKVYNLMAIGMVITGVVALGLISLATTTDPSLAVATLPNGKMLTNIGYAVFASPLRWVIMLAPLPLVFFLSFRIQSDERRRPRRPTFWVYAGLIGLSLSSIFLVYTAAASRRPSS